MSSTAPLARLKSVLPSSDAWQALGRDLSHHAGRSGERMRGTIAPATSRLRAGSDWVSGAGWVALTGAMIGFALGITQDWTELQALGAVCGFTLLLALAWILGRTALAVDFRLHRGRVVAGETATGRLELRNRGRRSLVPTRIELRVGQGQAHFMLPRLAHDEAHEQLFEVSTHRRGVIRVGPVSSVRSDPLSLLRRTQVWSESVDLYVHPLTVALASDSTGFIRDVEGVTTQDLSSNDVSFHALREYVPGDDRRAVHWRTTARVGKLMVRQFEETRRAHLLVVLPTSLDHYGSEDDLETAISVAGSLARHAYREDREVTIYTHDGALRSDAGPLLLDRLAEVEPSRTRLTLRALTARAAGAVPQASVCALVMGSQVQPEDVLAAHKRLPMAVMSFGLRCESSMSLRRRRVGDLAVVDLASVHDLPAAMRGLS